MKLIQPSNRVSVVASSVRCVWVTKVERQWKVGVTYLNGDEGVLRLFTPKERSVIVQEEFRKINNRGSFTSKELNDWLSQERNTSLIEDAIRWDATRTAADAIDYKEEIDALLEAL